MTRGSGSHELPRSSVADGAVGARGTDYAQALTLAGLLAGASLSLSRLYVGPGWVPAVWLSMACALGLAALLRRLGVGQLLSLVAMAAGFIVVTGLLLFPETLLVSCVRNSLDKLGLAVCQGQEGQRPSCN